MPVKRSIIVGATVGVLAGLIGIYVLRSDESKDDQSATDAAAVQAPAGSGNRSPGISKDLARGALAAFVVKPQRNVVPDLVFLNEDGKQVSIEEWRGRVVLLNLWATWCAPCRKKCQIWPSCRKLWDRRISRWSRSVLTERGGSICSLPNRNRGNSAQALHRQVGPIAGCATGGGPPCHPAD